MKPRSEPTCERSSVARDDDQHRCRWQGPKISQVCSEQKVPEGFSAVRNSRLLEISGDKDRSRSGADQQCPIMPSRRVSISQARRLLGRLRWFESLAGDRSMLWTVPCRPSLCRSCTVKRGLRCNLGYRRRYRANLTAALSPVQGWSFTRVPMTAIRLINGICGWRAARCGKLAVSKTQW